MENGEKMVLEEQYLEVKIVTRNEGAKRPNKLVFKNWQTNNTIDLPPVKLSFALSCFQSNALDKIEVYDLVDPFFHQSISMHILTVILNPP